MPRKRRPSNTAAVRLADASRIHRHPDPDAVSAYDLLTHDRVPANLGEPMEAWIDGVGQCTVTRAEYLAQNVATSATMES